MKTINLSQGNIPKQILIFSLPILLSELFQNLYNSADAFVIGNYCGTASLAAINICDSPLRMVIGFFNGMSIGASVVTARAFGRGDREALSRTVHVALFLSVTLGLGFSLAGVLLAPQLLALTGTSPEIYVSAICYLRIYLAGLVFTTIYNIGAGMLRAMGSPHTPFFILVAASVVNILLDILLVRGFGLNVAGAAVATVAAQCISSVLICTAFLRHVQIKPQNILSDFLKFPGIARSIIQIGIPSGIQNTMISISNMFLWNYVSGFSISAVAAVGVALRFENYISMPCKAFGLAASTFVSQNIGADHQERNRKGVLFCTLVSLTVVLSIGTALYTFAESCIALFNQETEVIATGSEMLRVTEPFYFAMALREILLGTLRGHGVARMPTVLSLAGMVGIRQLFLKISLGMSHDLTYVFYSYPAGWLSTLLFLSVYFYLYIRSAARHRKAT